MYSAEPRGSGGALRRESERQFPKLRQKAPPPSASLRPRSIENRAGYCRRRFGLPSLTLGLSHRNERVQWAKRAEKLGPGGTVGPGQRPAGNAQSREKGSQRCYKNSHCHLPGSRSDLFGWERRKCPNLSLVRGEKEGRPFIASSRRPSVPWWASISVGSF